MESQIEEILQSYFNDNIHISVSFVDFCEYRIKLNILGRYESEFNFSIDNKYTLNSNCINVIEKIESIILNLFKEEVKYE